MRKYIMLVVAMLVSSVGFSQHHGRGKEGSNHTDRMKETLSLTAVQEAKIKAIDEQFSAAHKKLKADTAVSVGSWHKRMDKLRTEHEASIKSVLTEEQRTKWEAEKTKRGGGRGGKHYGKRGEKG